MQKQAGEKPERFGPMITIDCLADTDRKQKSTSAKPVAYANVTGGYIRLNETIRRCIEKTLTEKPFTTS
jgi:hypothetical protein